MSTTRRAMAAALLLTTGFAAGTAQAIPVTWDFSGEVGSVFDAGNNLTGFVSSGSSFNGSITFESSQPDGDPGDPNEGSYVTTSYSLTVDSLTFSAVSASILISNDVPFDGVEIRAFPTLVAGGNPTLQGFSWDTELELIEPPPATILSDDSLPLDPPDLATFNNVGASFLVGASGAINIQLLPERIERVSPAIPEPGAAALFALGVAFVGLRVRRR